MEWLAKELRRICLNEDDNYVTVKVIIYSDKHFQTLIIIIESRNTKGKYTSLSLRLYKF
jgi:hypothetical protein